MAGKVKKPEEKAKVPAYIVTYSDMVTLLLTFFVMLLSLAEVQDPELLNVGRDSFISSIQTFGLGLLLGKEETANYSDIILRHPVVNKQKIHEQRNINAREEKIQRHFKEVKKTAKVVPTRITPQQHSFTVTTIRFSGNNFSLDPYAKKHLTEYAASLRRDPDPRPGIITILGLANEQSDEQKQWFISAKRAAAVAVFLQDNLPDSGQWTVYSLGAGPGGQWVDRNSPISEKAQILIEMNRQNL